MGRQRLTRKLTAAFLVICSLFISLPVFAAVPDTAAKSFILIEADTGRVLAGENIEEELPMASTTKIMTALLALEMGDLDEMVTVGPNAVGLEGTSIYLREGETLPLRDLVYGLMMASGNDAAVAIAEHLAGSVENFAILMNRRAKEIGANHTNFVTPNGLPAEGHYTTAYDLALISAEAMKNERFRQIVSTTSMDIPADDDSPARYLRSKNKLLTEFEGGNGIKTGYTKAAGKCLSAGAERDGMQLIAVFLNDPSMWDDSKVVLEYGFENYSRYLLQQSGESFGELPVQNGIRSSVPVSCTQEIYLPLTEEEFTMIERKVNLPSELKAPVALGQTVGTVSYFLNGEEIASAPLKTEASVQENTFGYQLRRILERWIGANTLAGWRNRADSEVFSSGGNCVAQEV